MTTIERGAGRDIVRKIDWGAVRTAGDKAAARAERARATECAAARRYLAQTDWYVIRASDTGAPVPEAVRARRVDARRLLSDDPSGH